MINRRTFLRALGLLPVMAAGAQLAAVAEHEPGLTFPDQPIIPVTQSMLDDIETPTHITIHVDGLNPHNKQHQLASRKIILESARAHVERAKMWGRLGRHD